MNSAYGDLKFHVDNNWGRWIATLCAILLWFQWLSSSLLILCNLPYSLYRLNPIFLAI